MHTRILAALLLGTLLLTACVPGAPAAAPTAAPTQAAQATQPNTVVAPSLPPAPSPTAVTPSPAPSSTPVPTAAPSPSLPPATPTTPAAAAAPAEILFLRGGNLIAYAVEGGQERTLAEDVRDFAATPDGRLLALVRGEGLASELWLLERAGGQPRQLTSNERAEGTPVFAPDGLTLAFASSGAAAPGADWPSWSLWCRQSEVRLLNVASGEELALGPGCDPAFAPDGLRIAFATAPEGLEPGSDPNTMPLGVGNAIRLVNRKGQNGWSFASAGDPAQPESGRLVYAPSFDPTGARLAYQRFVGYRVLTDLLLTEIGPSLAGQGQPMALGAGWMLAPRFSPDGASVALSEYNSSDARGFSGYDIWRLGLLRLEGSRSMNMPDGPTSLFGTQTDVLTRAQQLAWAPDGSALAVQLPTGWRAGIDTMQPAFPDQAPGELWRWVPGQVPTQRLAEDVDYASPILWLPPTPRSEAGQGGYRLVYPAGWQLASASEFEERTATAPDGALISAALLPDAAEQLADFTLIDAFGFFVEQGAQEQPPVTWPDGSIYREFAGSSPDGTPIAGAWRIARSGNDLVVLIYRTSPARWPLERAQAQSLLAAGGGN